MTRHVEHLVKRKKEAYVRLKKQGSDSTLEGYKVARKELKNALRRARRGYEKVLAGRIKESPKAFYTYVRNKRMARVRVGPIWDSRGNIDQKFKWTHHINRVATRAGQKLGML
eukprot:g17687.t1